MQHVFHQFRGETLVDYVPNHPSQDDAKLAVDKYLSNLNYQRETGRGLTLLGPAGVGKTKLGCIVLNKVEEDGYRIESIEMSSYIDLFLRRMSLLELVKHSDDETMLDQWMMVDKQIRQIQGLKKGGPDWVLFDDIGREHQSESGWSNHQLHDALRFRFDRGLPFIVTTNVPLDLLAERYGNEMISVLYEATTIVAIVGDDYRERLQVMGDEFRWNGDS